MKWVTVRTFTLPTQAMVASSVLQSEGIEFVLQDELTVQVDPFYSNAVGGVKLNVPEEQAAHAHEVLKQAGFDEDVEERPTVLENLTERITGNLPLIKDLAWPFRFAGLVLVVLFLAVLLVLLFSSETPR
ncbi:MAG: DUF2007 domain-containing protein [Chitinophagales bacterium]